MTISADSLLPQQQIYNFLRSVTIKYSPFASMVNNTLAQKGYAVNDADQTSWKYYLNMVGQYHVSDTPMSVVSLDTKQTIAFTTANLILNPRTRSAYLPGTAYYTKLCDTYPDQVDLIKSILFPAPSISAAINAPDFTLLAWGEGFLESWEEPILIMAIEKFLKIYVERWYFDFLDDEPYFYITAWQSLITALAMLLTSERMGNIKTPYVHSWHIWNELQAKGLDNYSDILDRKQAMFLYQNIDYLKANAGKQSNLIILANNLLDEFGVALYGRMVVQESETGAANYQLTPQLVPVRVPTDTADITADIATEDIATAQSEIYALGLTPDDTAETVSAVELKLGNTTLNYFLTKFLEIRPIPQNKPYAETLNMFLMETLVLSIIRGYNTQAVEIIDPLTNNAIYLPPSQLLALYHYAIQKSLGLAPVNFPTQANFYRSFTTTISTPAATIPWQGQTLYLSQLVDATEYLSGIVYDTDIQNPTDFSTMVSNLWLVYMAHVLHDENTLLDKKRIMLMYLDSLCHERRQETIDLVPGYTDYETWVGNGGIDIQTDILAQYQVLSAPETAWANLADTIISGLIPLTDVMTTFGNFTLNNAGYARLRQLFVQMCSYRVVFIDANREVNEFSVGAKLSTFYGPDTMLSYSDFIEMIEVSTKDTIAITSPQEWHRGFHANRITNMVANGPYTVTTVADTVSTVMTQQTPAPRVQGTKVGTTMTQGSLAMQYVGMVPVNPDPPVAS